MKTGKEIAKYALSFIGGTPTVNRYYSDGEKKTIDIMVCSNSQFCGANVFATLGLSQVSTGLVSEDKTIRVELVLTSKRADQIAGNVLASAAFELMNIAAQAETFGYGTIIQSLFHAYKSDATVEHCVLLHPVYWDKYQPLVDADSITTWLLAVPITETERKYIVENGLDSFENRLAKSKFDICDFQRESVI